MTTTIRRFEEGRRTAGLLDAEAMCRDYAAAANRCASATSRGAGSMADFDGSVSQIDVWPSARMSVCKREPHAVCERRRHARHE